VLLTGGLDSASLFDSNSAGLDFRFGFLDSKPVFMRVTEGLLIGPVAVLAMKSPTAWEGSDSALETLRETVENGGGSGRWGEEKINSLLVSNISSLPSEFSNVLVSLLAGLGKETREVTLELCKELPRSSSCRLISSDG
jgi:hypothetical protein